MKKKLFFSVALILLTNAIATAQVGIGTENPQATLDINGNLRIANRGDGENDEKVLTISSNGIVNEKIIKDFTARKFRTNKTIKSGESIIINNPQVFSNSNFNITSTNNCGRNMISSFMSSDGSVVLTGGIARDKSAEYTIEPIKSSESSYSPRIIVTFKNVLGCGGDGNDTQFNFSIKKLNNTEYEITNNGNVTRTYTITWLEI
ncbi:hypothetical protein SAMN05443634_10512 [Chishuiella changwenlii]|uniref:Uncharacterized protein n=1 Tax=Chishuiella changwenlii TaxID=1434701 RepID=A0A1M6WWM3_9FLAO|nr:hypothetical protein [Chishuiella changwenlii]GGE98936.1 hypothetical protein GCM10010984_15640 [Chishuiella changwenlii]SHK97959.1 hypothetical protein SAMN05443634_10512 [Chishuiella changwenlii]